MEVGGVGDSAEASPEGRNWVLQGGELEVDLGLSGVQFEGFGEGLTASDRVGEDEGQAVVGAPVLRGSGDGGAVLGGGFFGLAGSAGVGEV